jgi:glucose-6-phosphate-specific signal transduction histidine kinase
LTERPGALEFTSDDEKIIQMLAAYAAAAIQNARIMGQLRERDLALTRRNVDMVLLDGIASTLTSSLELDEILNKTLRLVMNYMKVETNVQITLWTTDERVLMEIHDGRGLDMGKMNSAIGHGLANMQTRAHTVSVDVDITSMVAEETTVLGWVPRNARG